MGIITIPVSTMSSAYRLVPVLRRAKSPEDEQQSPSGQVVAAARRGQDASEMMNGYAGPESGYFYYRPERIIDPAEIKAVEFFGQQVSLRPCFWRRA